MNNRNPQGPNDEASLPDGDLAFTGVEERTVFATAGFVNSAKNCRFRYNRAATRDGITILPWGLGNGLTPFTDVYGGFVYADPNGVNEYILIAANGGVYYTRPNQPARSVPLPQGVTLTRDTFKRFVQANSYIILLRGFSADGKDLLPLALGKNADGAPDFVTGFQVTAQENTWDTATLTVQTNRVDLVQHNLLVGDPVQIEPNTGVTLPLTLTAGQTYYVLSVPNGNEFTITATPGRDPVTWDQSGYAVNVTIVSTSTTAAAVLELTSNEIQLTAHGLVRGQAVKLAAPTGSTLPDTVTAGQTYYVLTVPDANHFTVAFAANGKQITWDAAGLDVTVTVLDGAYPIPEAADGVFAQNRLFLIDGKDTVAVSDIGDFQRYVPTQSEFRVNQGDAYTLKYLYLFNESTLLFFKNGLVSKCTGVSGDLSGAAGPLNVTQAYGIASPSVADIGTDVYWLSSELRVTSLSLTELNKEQGTDNALSDPLLQTFGRIAPQYADRARLAVYDGYLHVALPLDDAQILGTNVLVGATYNESDARGAWMQTSLTAGQQYQWLAGDNEQALIVADVDNNMTTYYGDTVFTVPEGAYNAIIILAKLGIAAGTAVTGQLIPVICSQCNTGVAVYDFLQKAWCGTDESQATCVVDWLKFTYNGKQQLAFIGADGYLHLYEDGYEDETVTPNADLYVDLFCDQLSPWNVNNSPCDELTINGGPSILQSLATGLNNGYVWGLRVNSPGANLWQDADGKGGFNPAAASPWEALNCTVEQIADGVRFIPTNGVLPTILINGTAVTGNVVNGNAGTMTYYFDWHSGSAITPVPITSYFLTRAYPCKSWASYALIYTTGGRMDFKRYVAAKLHIATWNPSYTISTLTQGQGDVQPYVEGQTRNPLSYFAPVDAAAWNADNSNDDYHAPSREDYSYTESGTGLFLYSGVNFDQMQEMTETVPLSERGIYVQLAITNTQGRLELAGVELEAQTGDQLSGANVKS